MKRGTLTADASRKCCQQNLQWNRWVEATLEVYSQNYLLRWNGRRQEKLTWSVKYTWRISFHRTEDRPSAFTPWTTIALTVSFIYNSTRSSWHFWCNRKSRGSFLIFARKLMVISVGKKRMWFECEPSSRLWEGALRDEAKNGSERLPDTQLRPFFCYASKEPTELEW